MTLGNNTIWLANAAVNVTTISYNITVRYRDVLFENLNILLFELRIQLDQIFNYLMKIMVQQINQ